MSSANSWADAIGAQYNAEGQLELGSVIMHVRDAIIEAGFVSRGRITTGLKEAYRPFGIEESSLRTAIDEALWTLLLSGDIDEFTTSAGRGYAATPPRRIVWGGIQAALLGSTSGGEAAAHVRRVAAIDSDPVSITIPLAEELGWPEWRLALVELGAADAPEESASVLYNFATALAASGERYSLDEPQTVSVLSGRGIFFGQAESVPSGRWERISGDGCFPAVIKSGFAPRYVVLSISDGLANLWQPQSRDIWRWIVVGATLAAGDAAINYDPANCRLDFLTPPPRQIERAALLTGSRIGPWSWHVDTSAFAVISELLGSPV